ncbi:MAG: response regulator transcription factor [Bacteriovoracaceae bacterium]|jgi:DNA-binding response OmpR family regulator|nr:response regulator transcription factor [Bacteriovoracaceae bacterium]
MHLTIVDDLEDNLISYQELLSPKFDLELIKDPDNLIPFLTNNKTDMIILDLHMPKVKGFDLYRRLKTHLLRDFPVIFVTADPSEEAVIEGLTLGAEDFISKPVSLRELEARIINKIKKISASSVPSSKQLIEYPGFKLYLDLQCTEINGNSIQLTPIEFKLISLFAEHPNEVFSRIHISNLLWPNIHVQNQNIDTHLSNLRKKLGTFSKHLKTIKSRGYILRI